MSTRFKSVNGGFTVIEVVLFLAVSSLLAIGIFAGATVNINNQRYHDAVKTFRASLQTQYTSTLRVENPLHPEEPCQFAGEAGTLPRGTSRCELIGKLLTIESGTKVTVRNILGLPPAVEGPSTQTDLEVLKGYQLGVLDANSQEFSPEWSTSVDWNGTSTFQLILLRSPSSGTILTYARTGNSMDVEEYVNNLSPATTQPDTTICVRPEGIAVADSQTIVIRSRGSSSNAVEDGLGTCT
jgi:hypothetical protein